AYNAEKTIRETMESVVNQTFCDWELIVINDSSQDGTIEVVSKIKDPRIKLFSYENAGPSASRNRGLDKAEGKFISFLDSDDLWTTNKLEEQLKALQANTSAGVAYSWTDYIDESSRFLRPGLHLSFSGDVYSKLLVRNFLENGSNPLIKREALNEVGGFDESLRGPEDWDMWLRLGAKYHFVVVKKPQILYRLSPNSLSTNIVKQEAECLRIIESAFAKAPQSLQYLKKKSWANLYKYLAWKALQGKPNRRQGAKAVRLIWNYAINEPSWRSQLHVIFKMGVKSIAAIIFPPIINLELLKVIKGQ
ncbi:MAG: glycosyltransferase, partial [Okeania sp. SIO2H7]|nr:glycosyltransferase [Okeania sp. SIO2H7]